MAAAPKQVAVIAEKWLLGVIPQGYMVGGSPARLGYAVGVFLGFCYDRGFYFAEDDRVKLWRAFLAAGAELPEQITDAVVTGHLPREGRTRWEDD